MRTAFVLGNGPSLKQTPWRALYQACRKSDVFSIGMNRIHLIYPEVSWRPDLWVIADRSKATHSGQDIQFHLDQGYPCYVRADIPRGAEAVMWASTYPDEFIPFADCAHIDVDNHATSEWHLHDRRPNHFCKMGGSLYVAVQLAVQEGAERIVLLGCDGNIRPNSENHFIEGYVDIDSHGVQSSVLANKNLKHCHLVLRAEVERRGIEYWNATQAVNGGAFTGNRIDIHEALALL